MRLNVGDKVKFDSEKQRYTVQASDDRFAICTKPMNALKTVLYCIIDFKEMVRGPEDLVFGHGAETREQCEEMLDRLNGRNPNLEEDQEVYRQAGLDPKDVPSIHSEVSYRHRCILDIERVDVLKVSL